MKIKSFLIHNFENAAPEELRLSVPKGSKYLQTDLLPGGLYAYCKVPSIDVSDFDTLRFKILKKDEDIPEGFDFELAMKIPTSEGIAVAFLLKSK